MPGNQRIFSVSGKRIFVEDVSLISFRLEDITESETLKTLVARLESRFHAAFENAKVNVWEYDISNERFYIFDYLQHTGNKILELDTSSLEKLKITNMHPDDRRKVFETVISLKSSDEPIEITYRHFNPFTDTWEYHQLKGLVTAWNKDGTPKTAQGTITNNSEIQNLKRERSHATMLYDYLFKQSPVMIMRIRHSDGAIMDANEATLRFCGKTLDEITGKHPIDIGIWPDNKENWAKLASVYDQDLVLQDIQVPLLDKDGNLHHVILSISFAIWNDTPSSLAIGLDITDAVRLQQELLSTQQRMQNALDAINEGYFELDLETDVVFANDNCLKILGFEPGEVSYTYQNWLWKVYRHDRKYVVESFRDITQGKIVSDAFRLRMHHKNGNLVWIFQQHSIADYDKNGLPSRVVGTITDLTEQIKVEQELAFQNDTLEATFNAIDEGIWEFDRRKKILSLNDRCKELVDFLDIPGLSPRQFQKMVPEIIHPDDLDKVRSAFRQMIEGEEENIQVEGRLSGDQQSWKWYNLRGGIIERDQQGMPIRMVGAVADISERKEFDWTMQLIQAGVEQSSMMAFLIRPDGSFHYVNHQSCVELGYSLDEMYRLNARNIDPTFPPLDDSLKEQVIEATQTNNQLLLTDIEVDLYRKDGTFFPSRISRRAVKYRDTYYFWVFAIDISTIKSMEQQLREEGETLALRVEERTQELAAALEYLDFVLQALPIPIYIKNERLEFIDANESFLNYFGVDREAIIGKTISSVSKQERVEIVNKNDLAILGTEKKIILQDRVINKDGEIRQIILMRQGFSHPKTGKHGIIGAFLDINERLELQKELEDANVELQRAMQVKDEFLANMSHELRTPLTSIIGYSELLLAGMGGKLHSNQEKYINHIHFAGKHLLTLINDILDYSKFNAEVSTLNLETVRIRSICIAALSIMEPRAFKKDIKMEFEFDDSITDLYCDPQRIRQIIINLMNNAIKFSDNYGSIGLRVKKVLQPEPSIEFQIWDNGIGISPEDQQRIFEPFTQVASDLNRNYEGSGIGLALVKKFVELHEGKIWVESKPGVGSTFYIQLPLGTEKAEENLN
jgi:PAS domain S-box-containing protein